jgi:phosphopantothenoylcysteine synthetase/decarboxylase
MIVTAGPTFEDTTWCATSATGPRPHGFAIAAEAAGVALMTLIAGLTTAAEPTVSELIRVRSAEEMHRAVMARRAVDGDHGRGRRDYT